MSNLEIGNQKTLLEKIFSSNGHLNKVDFIIYGILIPINFIIMAFFVFLLKDFNEIILEYFSIIESIILSIAFISYVNANIKRIRAVNLEIFPIIILSVIPYVNIVYIIYILVKEDTVKIKCSKILKFFEFFLIIFFITMGILSFNSLKNYSEEVSNDITTQVLKNSKTTSEKE